MITLNQAERLVRKIGELLGRPALEAQAAKLAQDYTDLGRAAHRRLEQCAAMIDAGDELQALQLAETPPPLLDLVTLLSFRQAGEWRAYCQGHNLPCPEPFYDKHIRQLNATYGKGLANDHPYYRDYRRAVMQNDDERALSILRVIARLNPADRNSAQELQRLEEKTLRARLEELRATLDQASPEAVLALVARLEASPLKVPPANPIWQRAQIVRCQKLLGQAQALRQQQQWQEAELVVEEIRALATQHTLVFPATDADTFEALEAWTAQQRNSFLQEQDFQRAYEALQYHVQALDTRRAALQVAGPAALQNEFNTLAVKWREVERFGRPLDEPLLGRCQDNCDWLKAQLNRGRNRQRLKRLAISLAAVALIAVAVFLGWDFFQQYHLVQQLGRLQSSRRVSETQRLLTEIPARLKIKGGLAAAIPKAQSFVTREMALKQDFADRLARLETVQPDSAEALVKLEQQRNECGQALERLAPEFVPAAKAGLDAFDQRWQNRWRVLQPEYSRQFAARLAEVEKAASQRLDPATGFTSVRANLPQVQALAAELGKLSNPRIPLDEPLVRRWRQLTNQIGGVAHLADQWTALGEEVPRSLEEHLTWLNRLSQSPFASAAERNAIAELQQAGVSPGALLGGLLLPRYPQAWSALTNLPEGDPLFRPVTPTPQERDAFNKLLTDPNLQDINDYYLTRHPHPDNPLESHHVFVRGKLEKNKFFQDAGLIYDWKKSPDTLQFEPQVLNSYDYVQADYKGLTKECAAVQALGLRDLLSTDGTQYQRAILELLDRLNQDMDASALFRAYVSLKLWDIAQQRPLEWGLPWAPAAALHVQKLMELGARELQSGDWMVSNRVARVKAPLERYFAQSRGTWFEKQARFLYRLTRQSSAAGFSFAGYANAQGNAVLAQTNVVSAEYWGWSSRSRGPALLLRRTTGAQTCEKLEEPLPLTPLFAFRGDRRQLLQQAATATLFSLREADPVLPPLFQGAN